MLHEVLADLPRLTGVDVGASPIDDSPPYQALLDVGHMSLLGFEPDETQFAALQRIDQVGAEYLPYAIGDGEPAELKICLAPGMTSLLEPKPEVLRHFHGFATWGQVRERRSIETHRLDDIEQALGADYLKIDVQGGELAVLKGAPQVLAGALVVHIEVQFVPFYQDQPLFADLDMALRSAGFLFHCFTPIHSRVFLPMRINDDDYAGLSQQLWSDAVYVRRFTDFKHLSTEQLLKLAQLLHDIYESIDMAALALRHADRKAGTRHEEVYLSVLAGALDGEREPSTLARNLVALGQKDRGVAERLRLPVCSEHVELATTERPASYHIHQTKVALALDAQCVEAATAQLPDQGDVLLFGVGLGELVEAILAQPERRLLAWERDPYLMRVALSNRDYRDELASGRLQLALGVDLVDLPEAVRAAERVFHPLFEQLYHHEVDLLSGVGNKRALLCAGGLFVRDLGDALREIGFDIYTVDASGVALEELELTISRYAPTLVACVNLIPGLPELTTARGVPLLCWEVDPTSEPLGQAERSVTKTHAFTSREANVPAFEAAGYRQCSYLPLAANTTLRRPLELTADQVAELAAPVSFVGASMLEEAQRHCTTFLSEHLEVVGATEENIRAGEAQLNSVLEAQRADWTRYRVPELLEQAFGDALPRMQALHGNSPAMLVGEAAAAERRLNYVAKLGPFGVHVWGDAGWEQLADDGVRYRGQAGHREELTRIYCASAINVDIGLACPSNIVSRRVFDVVACGSFLLAEHCAALETLFDIGTELATYRTLDELLEKVGYYLEHPEEAAEIAARGLRRVRRDHTVSKRVEHMLSEMSLIGSEP